MSEDRAGGVAAPGGRLVVGLVRGFHGLRGEVRVEVLSDRAEERFAPGRVLYAEGTDKPLTIDLAEADGIGWRLHFTELADRTAAEVLRGAYLEAVVTPAERPARGEYYWHEVIGSSVVDTDGRTLGKVEDIYRAGGGEVMLVRGPAGELDVPIVRSVVRVFAPRRGEIVVDAAALGLDEAVDDGDAEAGEPGDGEPAEAADAGRPSSPH